MNRIFVPTFALALATFAQAQTVRQSTTTTDGWGNTTTTTIEAPSSVAGLIANQNVRGTFIGGAPAMGHFNGRLPFGNNNNYYNYGPTYNNYNAPYGYVPPQTVFVPSQSIPLTRSRYDWVRPATITSLPQVITTPGYPVYGSPVYGSPYGGYAGYPNYNYGVPTYGYPGYGYSSRTTVSGGNLSFSRGGFSVNIGGGTSQTFGR